MTKETYLVTLICVLIALYMPIFMIWKLLEDQYDRIEQLEIEASYV